MLGRVLGFLSMALGLFALWAAPVSTVSCDKKGADVSCHVEQAMLGIVSLNPVQIDHVLDAGVDRGDPGPNPGRSSLKYAQPNSTYQLYFMTPQGRVAPRGADASEPSTLQDIVSQLHDLINGDAGPFTVRSYNGFPIVVGLIFTLVGLPCLISGS